MFSLRENWPSKTIVFWIAIKTWFIQKHLRNRVSRRGPPAMGLGVVDYVLGAAVLFCYLLTVISIQMFA